MGTQESTEAFYNELRISRMATETERARCYAEFKKIVREVRAIASKDPEVCGIEYYCDEILKRMEMVGGGK